MAHYVPWKTQERVHLTGSSISPEQAWFPHFECTTMESLCRAEEKARQQQSQGEKPQLPNDRNRPALAVPGSVFL